MNTIPREALTWARELADSIQDPQERSLVSGVIAAITENRALPSWNVMSPLMRAVALALQGNTRPWEPVTATAVADKADATYRNAPHTFRADHNPDGTVTLTVQQDYTGKRQWFRFTADQWRVLTTETGEAEVTT